MSETRWMVTHSDGIETEVVHDLGLFTARQLVEHEHAAGRSATMVRDDVDPFEGLDVPHHGPGEGSRRMNRSNGRMG